MISFAQNAEDVLVARFFDGDPVQTYVDVGAAHPIYHSVTKHFHTLGWRGINIEARQSLVDLLELDRPQDRNLRTCVSDKCGETTFFEVRVESCQEGDNGGLSTLDPALAAKYESQGFSVARYTIPVTTLSSILEREQMLEIGFLKIDVEGHEPEVVRGLDLERWRPRLIIVECTKPLSSELADAGVTEQLVGHRYHLAHFDGLNQFLVRDEDADRLSRLSAPVSVLDAFVPFRQVELSNAVAEKEQELQRLRRELHDQTQYVRDILEQNWELHQRLEQAAA